MENKLIYVPDMAIYECYVVRDSDVIRAYYEMPENGKTIKYRDYFYNSNYLYQDGYQTFSQYSTIPVCLKNEILTEDIVYRNDFDKILIIFLIMSIFAFYIPIKIFKRLFRRFN